MFKLIITLFSISFILSCASENPKKSTEATVVEKNTTLSANLNETNVEPEIDTTFSLDYLMGKFDPETHFDFVEILPPLSDEKRHLHKDVLAAFKKMRTAAKAEGINLTVKSATRNFANQKRIWESKWTGKRKIEGGKDATKAWPKPKDRALTILKWSSMPGTSRHHWGTDIDLNAFENEYFEHGQGLKEYEWLTINAANFGFCQVYTPKNGDRPTGYNEEKWHWSYIPIASKLTALAKAKMKDEMISGFEGAEVAKEVGMVQNFILGINKACL